MTFWVWRLSYVRSYNEVQGLLFSHIAIAEIVTDLFQGILLSAFIMVGQMIRRFVGHLAARWEMQLDRLEQMFNGLDDGDGAFDELVGVQGPVIHLVENAFSVSNLFC
ncbi:hypothetical protein Hanom_Chr13g01191491 [Helianthus anomalus]